MPRSFGPDGVRFDLDDPLDHPLYRWPRTLLSYPVSFAGADVRPGDLRLTDADGDPVPVQCCDVERAADGALDRATVRFFADLPSGGSRSFRLERDDGTGSADATPTDPVTTSRESGGVVVDAGALRVRLPASAQPGGDGDGGDVPGPILALDRGEGWVGESEVVADRPLRGFEAGFVERGPLVCTYRCAYEFGGGARYEATVEVAAGREFVRFEESVSGFDADEGAHLRTAWTGFDPTHRHAQNRPPVDSRGDDPGFDRYDWERVDQRHASTHNRLVEAWDPETGDIDFRLAPYEPWGASEAFTAATFWDEGAGDALGLFVADAAAWDDDEYGVWTSSEAMQVRYAYEDGTLRFEWPLAEGARSVGLACYDHARDVEAMDELERLRDRHEDLPVTLSPRTHAVALRVDHGVLCLDDVKDWTLAYDGDRPAVFETGEIDGAEGLFDAVFESELVCALPLHGARQNAGYNPVMSRRWGELWVDAYDRLHGDLAPDRRRRLTALYLLNAYVYAGEEMMPVVPLLAGHPNFLLEVKSVPAYLAALFPDHPDAGRWADVFETALSLTARYHTRPDVPAWDARGGRWTENLGCYAWVSLEPALRAARLLGEHFDGRNPVANPHLARVAEWLVNALTAPFDGEVPVSAADSGFDPEAVLGKHGRNRLPRELGPRRVFLPQGAHAVRGVPPQTMWLLGRALRRYQPLLADRVCRVARPDDPTSEDPSFADTKAAWEFLFDADDAGGTDPELGSRTYTGYGHVLRAGVGTDAETSVHLQQLDRGPNYRWGVAGQGGCGVVHYAAAGEVYSHSGKENVGDRRAHDTDFCCNFGVWTGRGYRSVGRNVLDGPRYDLGVARYAEVSAREGEDAYSWPAYRSRSVALVGTDYLVTYDAVFDEGVRHRFSWFVHRNDEFPHLALVRGGGRRTEVETEGSKGVWHDGEGDCMAVVSHRDDLSVERAPGGCRVRLPDRTDRVFRDQRGVAVDEGDLAFEGSAGVVRRRDDGGTELALFEGSRAAADGVSLAVTGEAAVGLRTGGGDGVAGAFEGGDATVRLAAPLPDGATAYVDGRAVEGAVEGDAVELSLSGGRHRFEVTADGPTPAAPDVTGLVVGAGEAAASWTPVRGATAYRVEVSEDGGETWATAGRTPDTEHAVDGLADGERYHLRVVAVGEGGESDPSAPRPADVTDEPPAPPDGLRLDYAGDAVELSWGEVRGAREYVCHRREAGADEWTVVYRGEDAAAVDDAVPVPPRPDRPGESDYEGPVFEYAVAAANGNGVGERSRVATTDPSRWRNWDPRPGERFRRSIPYALDEEFVSDDPIPPYPLD
ncbi:MAG: fibronectin type III domain-containing protein [Halobacteriaceae archaeon]